MSDYKPKLDTTYDDGRVCVDVGSLFDLLDAEGKRSIAERLACRSDVVESVVDQLVAGSTADGSWGYEGDLDAQRRRLIDAVGGEVLLRVVQKALSEAAQAKAAEEVARERTCEVIKAVEAFGRGCIQDNGCRRVVREIHQIAYRHDFKATYVGMEASLAWIAATTAEIEADDAKKREERLAAKAAADGGPTS